jgi:hypothetical protein
MVKAGTLSKLSKVAKKLNSESDSVNVAIGALNEQLREMNLGVEAWVQIADSGFKLESRFQNSPRKYSELTLLGYCKIEDKWQLAINEQTVDYEPDPDDRDQENELTEDCYTTPLIKATRELRVSAVEHFDELLEELNRKAERTLAGIERAKELAVPK